MNKGFSIVIGLRLNPERVSKLDRLAGGTNRQRCDVMRELIDLAEERGTSDLILTPEAKAAVGAHAG